MPEETLSPLCLKTARVLSRVLGGLHHLPSKIVDHGNRCEISVPFSRLSTFDFNDLTQLVVLSHDECMRLSLYQGGPRLCKLVFHDREGREGGMAHRHPTMEEAVADARATKLFGDEPSPWYFKKA